MSNNPSDSATKDPLMKRLADRYDRTSLAYFFRVVEPTGIFLTVVGLMVAGYALLASLQEISDSRNVREATLLVMLTERLDIARTRDAGKSATYEVDEQEEE